MAATPRPHRFSIPMATRSTDVSMMGQCPGRFVLTCFYEQEQAEASFFILGSLLHSSIECSIVFDLDLDGALRHYNAALDAELERVDASPARRIESSKRGFDTLREDGERMLGNWFRSVHPDSAKRHPIYDDYEWPPRTEVPFMFPASLAGTKYPVWGSVDAIFKAKTSVEHALVDWKSGTSRQRTDDQLHFYEFGLSTLEIQAAWFHHLDKVRNSAVIQEVGPWPGSAAIRQRILETEAAKERIVAGHMPEFNPSFLCPWCPVQQFCPADGDVRDRPENQRKLQNLLRLAKPMQTIERVA